MADRIIKGDSGNDVVIQNNDASRKIEVTNSGDVEVTGDFKATTVKATNLKANDGTASLSIADSTGRVTFNENNSVITLGSNATFPAGHVIQTVNDTDTNTRSTTSSSYEDVGGLSCPITSVGLNSKFLISAVSSMTLGNELYMNIKRVISGGATTTELASNTYGMAQYRQTGEWGTTTFFYLDSPTQAKGTTITYSLRFKNADGSSTVYWLLNQGLASMTVLEIAV
jgi:hypothetical protein